MGVRSEILSAESFWEDPFGGDGVLFRDEPSRRVWIKWNEAKHSYDQCTVERVDPLLDQNRELYNESEGKRWGDGKIAARIPLNTWLRKILPAVQNGDDAWIKRWLNDGEHQKFRTFKGNL